MGQIRATSFNLRMLHWNAEWVRNKKLELQVLLKERNIDVCCIQETHLNSRLKDTRLSEETGKIYQMRNRYPCKERPRCIRSLQVRRRRHGGPWYQGATWQKSSHNLQSILTTQQTAASPFFSAWPRPMYHHGWLQQTPPSPQAGAMMILIKKEMK